MKSVKSLEPLELRRSQLNKLVALNDANLKAQESLGKSIDSYRSFSPTEERDKVKRMERAIAQVPQEIADQEVRKSNLESTLKTKRKAQVNPLFFWRLFSEDQKNLRTEVSSLKKSLSDISNKLSQNNATLSTTRHEIWASKTRLIDHETFDIKDAEARFNAKKEEVQKIKLELEVKKIELQEIEEKIFPHTQILEKLVAELAALNTEISAASRFDQRLSSASNSKQRALIHNECEAKFGTGSPRQVINDRRSRIRSIENNIPKIERRIQDELKKLDRVITHLIVDGNNLCYEGQSFIGLLGISALLETLDGQFKISVVFDASIRAMLKTDTQGIEKVLGASAAIHVAPTKTAADEYLMKLAGKEQSVFILSNDRFAEYHDYDVVKTRRVLRFLIADGQLMAHELDISISI